MTADEAWKAMVQSCAAWAEEHLDQWGKFQFQTEYGPVYVRIARGTQWPEEYHKVDKDGNAVKPT
jgi:hypothetical protein